MSTRFRWQVGSDHPVHAGVEELPEAPRPAARTRTRFALTRGFIVAYVAAVIGAALGGFGLGRWSEARGALLHGIEGAITVETLAWNDADIGLFESRLDPLAPPEWRSEQLARFEREAPRAWSADAVRIDLEGETAIVELEIGITSPVGDGVDAATGGDVETVGDGVSDDGVGSAGTPRLETRRYRSIGGLWVWRGP